MLFFERFIWAVATVFLFMSGIYFTIKLKGVQFRIGKMFNALREKNNNVGLSPFKLLTMTLGARIGVGSLAGIALAIYYGGVGTIFWIWISSIICSANAFAESVLGVLYREKDRDNYIGGPSYYIDKGMKKKSLGKLYAIMIIFAYILGFLTVQVNTIVRSVNEVYNFQSFAIAGLVAFLTLIVIFKGLNSIADFSSKLVPIMSIGYILICLYILSFNIGNIPAMMTKIVVEAFNPTTMAIGFITPLIIGVQRGIFSNEAGLGTGAIAAATASTNSPSKQGFIQVFGIHIETLIMTTLTALVIMASNQDTTNLINLNGIEITQRAFSYQLRELGNYVIMISILLFAFSTIITGYYYGESNLKFLWKHIPKIGIIIFRLMVAIILFLGGIISPRIIWLMADIFIVIIGIINVYSLYALRSDVINSYKQFQRKK